MFNLIRLATANQDVTQTGRTVSKSYRVAGILGLLLVLLVGWESGAGRQLFSMVAHAAVSTYDYPLYAWGGNFYGQLGNGTTNNSNTPLKVSLPAGVVPTAIAAGYYHSLAIGTNGKLYAWGDNTQGQLGIGPTTGSSTPVTVSLPAGVIPTAIAAGFTHNLAIGSDGKLYTWGNNLYGQLGNGSTVASSTPVTVSLPAGVKPTAIAAGGSHSLAIGDNGKLYAWGYNRFGQLGNGTTSDSNPNPNPLPVGLPTGVAPTAIAAGDDYNLATGSDGKLYAWGYNYDGELGNGTNKNDAVPNPVVVSLPAGITPTAITAGNAHSLAIGSDGNLYTWGSNRYGQLGNGTTIDSSIPVTVSLPSGVTPTAIAAGDFHSLAIGSNSKLYAWGYNRDGELGNATNNNSSSPLVAGSTAGISHPLLAARYYYHSMAQLALPSQIVSSGGAPLLAQVGTGFPAPLVATVRDVANNPVSSALVTFTAPSSGASGTFAGGSLVYTTTSDASGVVTATAFTANTSVGNYTLTATVSGVITPATFALTNLCNPLLVTLNQDDGNCGTLRYAVDRPLTSKAKTITIDLAAGTTINLTTGLTLSNGVSITTTAPCSVGPGNTMLPPVIIQGVGANSGNGLTLGGNNQLYGLWVRGFSGNQIKAPPGSSTKMQCVRASKL